MILHPELDERLRLCDTALDLPDWWVPGKHDKDLLFGATRHGLSRMEYFVLNDPDLSFRDILKRHLTAEPLLDKKAMKEFMERKKMWKVAEEEEVKKDTTAKEEPEVKKEEKNKADEYEFKDEEDEIEKPPERKKDKRRKSSEKSKASEEDSESKDDDSSPRKARKDKEESPKVEEMREARSRRKSTKDASEATRLAIEASKMAKADKEKKQDKKKEKDKDKEKDKVKEEEPKKEEETKCKEDDFEPEQKVVNFPPSTKAKKEEPEIKTNKEAKLSVTATAPPKRKVSVSIPPPNITMQQMEQMAKGGMLYDMEVMNELMAQTYAAAIRWPKDQILEIRLLHVISCVEHGVWPVPDDYALGDHLEEEVRQ